MLAIIVSWTLLFIIFLSFGEMTVSLWNKATKDAGKYSIIDKIWIGLCSVGVISLYLSIFIPLNFNILITISIIALVYLLFKKDHFKKHLSYFGEKLNRERRSLLILYSLLFIAILGYALAKPLLYDIGLYHLQSMQWIENYKVVTGLGNLHGRLGFNSSFLLLTTLLNYHPNQHTVFFSINSFALLLFSWWIVTLFIKHKNIVQRLILFSVLLSVFILLGKSISSSSTDILPNILVLYLLISWCANANNLLKKSLLIGLLPIFCITLKLSSVPILFITILYIVYSLYKRNRRIAISLIILGIIIATPWISRFVLLTGYLVYPFAAIDIFSFDWKMPTDMVVWDQNAAYAWARVPNQAIETTINYSFTEWFPLWIKSLSVLQITLYVAAFLSPIFMLFVKEKKLGSIAWLIAYTGLIFGFVTAPDFRFTFGFIIAATIIPFYLIACQTKIELKYSNLLNWIFTIALIGIIILSVRHLYYMQNESSSSAHSLIYQPQSGISRDKIYFDEYLVDDVNIYVPLNTNQCFDQQIPCTPYYDNNLELRGKRIQDGFRIKK